MGNPGFILLCCALATFFCSEISYAQEAKDDKTFSKSEDLVKSYTAIFKDTDVPTPEAYVAAYNKATATPSIATWEMAAETANKYANIVGVLKDHYADLYSATQSSSYIHTAAAYETRQNKYLGDRNNAYLEMAKLYLANGDVKAG